MLGLRKSLGGVVGRHRAHRPTTRDAAVELSASQVVMAGRLGALEARADPA